MGWLNGWTYRKSHSLSRASGAVTNYQMKLLLGESSGATGGDVDAGGLCATDFHDIRFTTSDGVTLLDYWIESISGTTPNQLATVWIEFDYIDTITTQFYMYYGKESAIAVSNGPNTFLFHDHFDGDLSKWLGDTEITSISSSICTVHGGSNDKAIASSTAFSDDIALRARVNMSDSDIPVLFLANNISGAATQYNGIARIDDGLYNSQIFTPANIYSNAYLGFGSYHVYDLTREITGTATAQCFFDDTQVGSTPINVPTEPLRAMIRTIGSLATVGCDWILIRQYLSIEPTWGTWGERETDIVVLAVDSLGQTIETAGVVLTPLHNLLVDGLSQAQTIHDVLLTQSHILTIAGADQVIDITNVILTQLHNILVNNLSQHDQIGSLSLSQLHKILVDSIAQYPEIENLSLTQKHTLIVEALWQTLQVDVVRFLSPENVATILRTINVSSLARTLNVPSLARTLNVPSLARTIKT